MSMVVKNNMSAVSTLNTLNKNSSALASSLKKVSSGMKINSAADDASGYAISERMRVQIRGLDQANQNTQNGTSMMKVAEGAVSSTVDILKTLKEKVINAANDTNTDADRATIQKELDQSIDQINDNANVTYNGKYLVDGSHNSKVTATTTALTNESLGSDTKSDTAFSDMTDRNGNSLNIQKSDTITMSVVKEGKTSTFSVRGSETLQALINKGSDSLSGTIGTTSTIGSDVAGDTVSTADGGNAITISAKGTGVTNQVSGLTFSVTNTKGQVQKSANAVLDNFSESIRAQNKSDDNAINLQVGTKANQSIRVGLTDMRAEALGL
ncbi:MAG: flagellin, partial [Selenomonas sp.]